MSRPGRQGVLFVVSAPSGTGKTTLAKRLLDESTDLAWSVSYTTRPRRTGEEDGREYHFLEDAGFDEMVARGAFLEWAPVFGRRYGTGREETERRLSEGKDLVVEIDVQGARQIRETGMEAVSVFIMPPSYRALASRLHGRGSDDPDEVRRRLKMARGEAEEVRYYDYVVINDDLDRALGELASIVVAERRRRGRCAAEVDHILQSFPSHGTGPEADR